MIRGIEAISKAVRELLKGRRLADPAIPHVMHRPEDQRMGSLYRGGRKQSAHPTNALVFNVATLYTSRDTQ
jgi:hypothetical protein